MRRLVAVILTPACLAACTLAPRPEAVRPTQITAQPSPSVSAKVQAAYDRYAALFPRTIDPPTPDQTPYFTGIEELLLGARKATLPWNRELVLRAAQDQFWRGGLDVPVMERLGLGPEDMTAFRSLIWARVEEMDTSNTAFLKAEVDRRGGWPPKSEVGDGASHFAWLLVQHADRDPAFQRRVLDLMAPMVATGETNGVDFAYLFDRVAKAAQQPQRFGTQGTCVAGESRWAPFEIEDEARLDERRISVGLQPMVEYVEVFKERRLCEGQ